MATFIDRRLNPKGKSHSNRQKFLRRSRQQIKEAIKGTIKDRGVRDADKQQKIKIRGTEEPRFVVDPKKGGDRDIVIPGNTDFSKGDQIMKPPSGGGGRGREGAPDGDGQDDFYFTLTQDEMLDIFFEDMELPNLTKTTMKEITVQAWRKAGISTAGTPSNLNLRRTMRNAHGRRLALGRPRDAEVQELKARLFELENISAPSQEQIDEKASVLAKLEELEAKRKWIPYIDPVDVRYNTFEQYNIPVSRAVMFCLMDVSGSMGEREKDLAKRFFMLLHLFLKRQYDRIDIVFIRHTHMAQEVDEDTFFYSTETGGTIVSTALEEMLRVWKERYDPEEWNIYVAQATDGYTTSGDTAQCVRLLNRHIMPQTQYFAYIEILDEREMEVFGNDEQGAELWRGYRTVQHKWENFAAKRISKPGDIYPVFRELFSKNEEERR